MLSSPPLPTLNKLVAGDIGEPPGVKGADAAAPKAKAGCVDDAVPNVGVGRGLVVPAALPKLNGVAAVVVDPKENAGAALPLVLNRLPPAGPGFTPGVPEGAGATAAPAAGAPKPNANGFGSDPLPLPVLAGGTADPPAAGDAKGLAWDAEPPKENAGVVLAAGVLDAGAAPLKANLNAGAVPAVAAGVV